MTPNPPDTAATRSVWLVVNSNRETVSIFDSEAAAETVVERVNDQHPVSSWRVERWAVRSTP